jgi:hypothetical protein
MRLVFQILLILFFFTEGFSQGEIDDERKILYRNEKSFGFMLNSNGYGAGYRFAKRINIHRRFIYDGDFNYVKHQKEKKIYNPYSASLRKFVYGKTNTAFNIRFGVGQHHEIFKKFDKNSVSVRYYYIGGVSAMFLKPIYYQVLNDSTGFYDWERFQKNTPWWYITDKKPFTYALNEIKIVPGGYVKTGFGFEFSKEDKRINMIDVGVSLEVYPYPVKIMETEDKQILFPMVYLSYRFGKAVSGYYLKELDEAQ